MQGVLALGCYTSQVRRRRCRLVVVSAGGVGGVANVVVVVVVMMAMMMANWRCCEGAVLLAGSGERARLLLEFACGTRRIVPRKARRGSGWPGLRWWAAVERAVGE